MLNLRDFSFHAFVRGARRPFVVALAALLLGGCAAQMAYRDGRELVEHDHIEQALQKFQDAVQREPHNAEYRSAYLQTRERAVYAYLHEGDRLAAAGQADGAGAAYRRALAIDPANEQAQAGLRNLDLRERHRHLLAEAQRAFDQKDPDTARAKLATVLAENPADTAARALQDAIAQAQQKSPAGGTLAAIYKKRITLEFKDVALKRVFDIIARSAGLNILFDKDVRTDQRTSIFLRNSTIEAAVHFLLLTNQLEQTVLDANTILVYPNTPAKLKDYQPMMVKTFFLNNADAKTVANTLKTIVKSRDIVVDDKLNMLIVRDSPDAIRIAEKLVALQDVGEPEVMLEVEILEVKRTRLLELGIQWPDSLSLTPIGSTPLTLSALRHLNSDTLQAGIAPATITAHKDDSDANLLANPRIRVRNHEKAKILIGEKVPNITTTATSSGFVSESINYVDVGLTLNVEPVIYLNNDVSIKIALEVSNIVSQIRTQSGTVAYQIGTRDANTVLQLKDGETQVLAGLINDEDRRSGNRVPGLGELPVLGRLFGTDADDNQKTEIVLSITPHLIRNIHRPAAAASEFEAGTETSLRSRPDFGGGNAGVTVMQPGASVPATAAAPAIAGGADPVNAAVSNGTPLPPYMSNGGNPGTGGSADGGISNSPQLSWDGPQQVKAGDSFRVQLKMQAPQAITTLPLTIGFDPKLLQVTGIEEGNFLKQRGAATTFSSAIDPNGQIHITATRNGDAGPLTSDSVAVIALRALAASDAAALQVLDLKATAGSGQQLAVPLPQPYTVNVQP